MHDYKTGVCKNNNTRTNYAGKSLMYTHVSNVARDPRVPTAKNTCLRGEAYEPVN